MKPSRRATYVNYQARASAFKVGDRVYPILKGNPSNGGTVVAVWPAIGMVDVQYPHGTARAPVEDLLIDRGTTIESEVDIQSDTVPGGTHTVPVSGGPGPERTDSTHRVASRYVKQAVYWAAPNRQYRPTKEELTSGNLCCPRCDEAYLRKTVYKREGGASTKLFCCPECLFLIRRDDILGFEE
jgi:hypothetical protein